MSRMIFGIALCFALAVVVGCGSKPAPPPPSEPEPGPKTVEPTPPNPKVETPKVEVPKVVWEMDPAKHAIPNAPVSGTLGGAAITPVAVLEGPDLKFRVFKDGAPNPEREITITLLQPAEGRKLTVKPDEPNSPELPKIFAQFPPPAPDKPGGALFPGSHALYALTLELGARKDGKVSGRIYLSLQDEAKSVLAGTFVADYVRPHTDKPGPDDAPYAAGEVIVGAGPKPEVRVAYVALLPDGTIPVKELVISADELVQWTRDDSEKPRASTLVAGDGKMRPFRYEHVRLPAGRYLLSAAVKDGPTVWKWVDITATSTLTEMFVLDVSKTGGLEIAVPPGAMGKVLVAPADEPTRPPLDAKLFEVLSVLTRIDAEIVGGKAVVKNLGTGRYEVRFGDERRIVDIVPGKTAEVNLTPVKK